jgi:hypothetical protein
MNCIEWQIWGSEKDDCQHEHWEANANGSAPQNRVLQILPIMLLMIEVATETGRATCNGPDTQPITKPSTVVANAQGMFIGTEGPPQILLHSWASRVLAKDDAIPIRHFAHKGNVPVRNPIAAPTTHPPMPRQVAWHGAFFVIRQPLMKPTTPEAMHDNAAAAASNPGIKPDGSVRSFGLHSQKSYALDSGHKGSTVNHLASWAR